MFWFSKMLKHVSNFKLINKAGWEISVALLKKILGEFLISIKIFYFTNHKPDF